MSASPTATTGYGGQTFEICSRLLERHLVVCIGTVGDVIVWGGRQTVRTPSGKELKVLALSDPQSAPDLLNKYYAPEYNLDLIIGFMDAFALEFLNDVRIPVIGYIPVDGLFTDSWRHYLRNYYRVVAYSRFGYHELLKWFPPSKVHYIPHGISTDIFKPLKNRDEIREEFEREYGIPKDAVLYVNVGANVGMRKEIPLLMRTFKRLVQKGYEKAYLFIHTNAYQVFPRGFDLIAWRGMLGMEKHIHFPAYNPIVSPVSNEQLARIYNAADVYVQNSVAEGYGLPIVEAMSCGRPVIAPLNSAQTELVTGHGWPVENVPEEMYAQIPVYVPMLTCLPSSTLISTPFGELPIQSIVEEELPVVYGYKDGEVVLSRIFLVSDREVDEALVSLRTEHSCLYMTKEHPVFVNKSGYVKAEDLRVGMDTLSLGIHVQSSLAGNGGGKGFSEGASFTRRPSNGDSMKTWPRAQRVAKFTLLKSKATSIRRRPYKGKVYNLTTETGNFFANGILVHNCYPVPNQVSLLEKLEEAYNSPSERRRYGREARRFVVKNYSWEKVIMPKWFEFLETVEDELSLFKSLR